MRQESIDAKPMGNFDDEEICMVLKSIPKDCLLVVRDGGKAPVIIQQRK